MTLRSEASDGLSGPGAGRRVLVVEDRDEQRRLVVRALEREGFRVEEAADGLTGLARASEPGVDLVILDVNLPGLDGLEVLRRIRQAGGPPVILATAREDETDRVAGLEMGADDYVVKPFSVRELTARVKAVLRRHAASSPEHPLTFDGLVIDVRSREVFVADEPVDLRPKEFDLLTCLASSPRQVFTREQLLRQVWGSSGEWQQPGTVTEHIHRLREKIETDPSRPRWVKTVRGVGYRFSP